MITIDSDLDYLKRVYQINVQRVNNQNYESVDELTQANAASASGVATAGATGQASQINNSDELLKVLSLDDPKNRFAIIENFSHKDMKEALALLDKEQLVLGLNFFTKEKLLMLISEMPQESITKILMKSFSTEQILKFMPEKMINNFLQSDSIDKKQLLAALKEMNPEILQSIYEGSTGNSAQNMTKNELLNSFSGMKQERITEGLMSLPLKQKKAFSAVLINNNEKLLQEFPATEDGLLKPLIVSGKAEITESMSALEPKELINTLDELPDELLAMVVTQIDPEVFADLLIKEFPEIISQIAG